jgi:threonyl-tRNA synthetase
MSTEAHEFVVRDPDGARRTLRFETPEGREAYWHSTSHLLAQAVRELFPEAKLAIGPPIEDGFYYDIDIGRPFAPEDLQRIEKRMKELTRRNLPIEPLALSRAEARALFERHADKYKLELLDGIPDEPISFYRQGEFLDMCRGPHLESTGRIKAVKLLSTGGAYWRGDEKREQLARIYGISFPDDNQLADHLQTLEEAKRRDHRKLGRELDIFIQSEEVGQGIPLWLPRGATLRRTLERYIVDLELQLGYEHVYTPPLANVDLYKISGHWDHYRDNMYPVMKIDSEELVLRPMNCPHHIMIYKHGQHSYRELPVRIAELGLMHRYERSGVLTGLARVRGMVLNDAHIFCMPDQIKAEFMTVVEMVQRVYRDLGIADYVYTLSRRDPANTEKFAGADAMWENAEALIVDALRDLGLSYREDVGGAAFYGPKLDIDVKSAAGKYETLSTIQVDFLLPERFDLAYIGEDNKPHRPVMIHRGVISTLERMTAFLIELHAGAFPLWLAPEQVRVLPIADRHVGYAHEVAAALKARGLRVHVDGRNEKIGKKIREAQLLKTPYMLVVGDKEEETKSVAVRHRTEGDLGALPLEAFTDRAMAEASSRR